MDTKTLLYILGVVLMLLVIGAAIITGGHATPFINVTAALMCLVFLTSFFYKKSTK